MAEETKTEDRPKIILLCVALLVAVGFIGMTIFKSNKEQEVAANEMDNVSLMLPVPTVNSGAMLLWNVDQPVGRNPFKAGAPGSISAAAPSTSVDLDVDVTPKPPVRPVEPPKPKLSKTIVVKGVVLNVGTSSSGPVTFLEVGGVTSTYRVGQTIINGAVLTSIGRAGVVLTVFGVQEFLGVNQSIGPNGR